MLSWSKICPSLFLFLQVALIVIFSHFQIDNTIDAMRKVHTVVGVRCFQGLNSFNEIGIHSQMFALVFSRDQQVRDSVLRACESLFMAEDDPFEIARTLISLVTGFSSVSVIYRSLFPSAP